MNADFFPIILVNQPTKLRFCAEVQKQANLNIRRPKIVQQLFFMSLINCARSFELQQNLAFNEQVCSKISDLVSPERDHHGYLPLDFHPA